MKKVMTYLLILFGLIFVLPFAVSAADDNRARLVISCSETDGEFGNMTVEGKKGECAVKAAGNLSVASGKKITDFTFSFNAEDFGEGAYLEDNDADDYSLSGDIDSDSISISAGDSTFTTTDVLFYIKNVTIPSISDCTYEKNGYDTGYYYQYKFKTLTYTTNEDNNPQYSGILNSKDSKLRVISNNNTLSRLTVNGVTPQNFDAGSTVLKLKYDAEYLEFDLKASDKTATIVALSIMSDVNIDIDINKNEYKRKNMNSYYGMVRYQITVKAESGETRNYELYLLKNIDLFAGRTDFEFDLENYNYTYNIPETVKYFGICEYDKKADFVANDELLCMDQTLANTYSNLGIKMDVFESSLSVNNINPYNAARAMSSKTSFEKLNNSAIKNDHETLYHYLVDLNKGENIVKFKLNNEYGYYTIKVVRGGATENEYKEGDNSNTHVDSEGNITKEEKKDNNSGSNNSNSNVNKKDTGTISENPETGVIVSIVSMVIVAAGCVGAYIYYKKHNKFPQSR